MLMFTCKMQLIENQNHHIVYCDENQVDPLGFHIIDFFSMFFVLFS